MISEDMQNNLIVAAVIVIAMFISMRALYGYWPWQTHPKLRKNWRDMRKEVTLKQAEEAGFNFEPVAASVEGAFRPVPMASGVEPDLTKPPPFPIFPASTAAYKPPPVTDHFDRGQNDNGETKPHSDSAKGSAHTDENEAGPQGVYRKLEDDKPPGTA
jgi:hypothetical protein